MCFSDLLLNKNGVDVIPLSFSHFDGNKKKAEKNISITCSWPCLALQMTTYLLLWPLYLLSLKQIQKQVVNMKILGVWFSFIHKTKIPPALLFFPAHYAWYTWGVSATTCCNGNGNSESPAMVSISVNQDMQLGLRKDEWTELEVWAEKKWDGMGWDRKGSDGMGWDRKGWDGMGSDGISVHHTVIQAQRNCLKHKFSLDALSRRPQMFCKASFTHITHRGKGKSEGWGDSFCLNSWNNWVDGEQLAGQSWGAPCFQCGTGAVNFKSKCKARRTPLTLSRIGTEKEDDWPLLGRKCISKGRHDKRMHT